MQAAPARHGRSGGIPWRKIALVLVFLLYAAFTVAVVKRTVLVRVDKYVFRLHLRDFHQAWYPWAHSFVSLGQRAPATLVALPWFVWISWKYRTPRPLIMLVTALLVLNVSVGVMKLATGRLGPLTTH